MIFTPGFRLLVQDFTSYWLKEIKGSNWLEGPEQCRCPQIGGVVPKHLQPSVGRSLCAQSERSLGSVEGVVRKWNLVWDVRAGVCLPTLCAAPPPPTTHFVFPYPHIPLPATPSSSLHGPLQVSLRDFVHPDTAFHQAPHEAGGTYRLASAAYSFLCVSGNGLNGPFKKAFRN